MSTVAEGIGQHDAMYIQDLEHQNKVAKKRIKELEAQLKTGEHGEERPNE
jgi:hypothetical protein